MKTLRQLGCIAISSAALIINTVPVRAQDMAIEDCSDAADVAPKANCEASSHNGREMIRIGGRWYEITPIDLDWNHRHFWLDNVYYKASSDDSGNDDASEPGSIPAEPDTIPQFEQPADDNGSNPTPPYDDSIFDRGVDRSIDPDFNQGSAPPCDDGDPAFRIPVDSTVRAQ